MNDYRHERHHASRRGAHSVDSQGMGYLDTRRAA